MQYDCGVGAVFLIGRSSIFSLPLLPASSLPKFLVLGAWLLIATGTFAQDAQVGQSVSIHGTVVNSLSHQPISRAQVYSQDNRLATMTDDQGHFEVILAPARTANGTVNNEGSFFLARKPGFLTDLEQRGTYGDSQSPDTTISLVPEAILMGRVEIGGDSPDSIHVQLFHRIVTDGVAHWNVQNMATTNSKGEYRFAELEAGDYRVGTIEAPDHNPEGFVPGKMAYAYSPVYFPAAADFSGASTIHLSPGKIFEADISLSRQQYHKVAISINGPSGEEVNVSVSAGGDGAPGYSLGYNAVNKTIQGSLPNGTYVVEATTFSRQSATGSMTLRVANAPAQGQMTLLPDENIGVQVREEFTNTSGGVHLGLGSSGRARHPYLTVALEPISEFGQGRSVYLRPPRDANDESLVIASVPPGRYWVRVTSSRGYAASITSGGLNLQTEPLTIAAGGSSGPIEITMRDDTASFDGTIDGASLPGSTPFPSRQPLARVYCIPQDGAGQFAEMTVSSDGKFESPPIPPGTYRILAFKYPQRNIEYRNADAMRAYESQGQIVRLVSGQKEHVKLQLTSKADQNGD